MTPFAYQMRLRSAITYVATLICGDNPDAAEIGMELALLPDSERALYITNHLLSQPENSRAYEIGADLLAILSGSGERVA